MSRSPRTTEQEEVRDQYVAGWQATQKLLREGKSFSGHERNCVFLNCSGERFANISAVAGLDFDDDGRAIAAVDWDHDGDLDFWHSNRTGPRLRFLRNYSAERNPQARHLTLRLRGTTCNRDAIGSRVQVVGTDGSRQARTLYAGDGYLSQSSKWLHFGLGDVEQIQEVAVRWPDGEQEVFSGVTIGGRYLLEQGHGQAVEQRHPRQTPELAADSQPHFAHQAESRTVLSSRMPMPLLSQQSGSSASASVELGTGVPQLLIIWSHTCSACRDELQEFTDSAQKLSAAGLDVLALSVDGVNGGAAETDVAEAWLRSIQFPFRSEAATAETLDKLALLMQIVLNREPQFAVPMSCLIDSEGELAVLFRGQLALDQLLADVRSLDANAVQRRDLAVPFSGRWAVGPRALLLQPVARVFQQHGYLEDHDRYLDIEVQRFEERIAATDSAEKRQEWNNHLATACFALARSLQAQGRQQEAIQRYDRGLKARPDAGPEHYALARAYWELQQAPSAESHLRRAVELTPEAVEPRVMLARIHRSRRELEQAIDLLETARETDANHVAVHFELGLARAALGEYETALNHLRLVTAQQPEHVEGWLQLGRVASRQGEGAAAVAALRRAVQIAPDHFGAQMNLGEALTGERDYPAAIEALRAAAKLAPDAAPPYSALARIFLQQGDPVRAGQHLEQALQRNTEDTNVWIVLAWLRATAEVDEARAPDKAISIAERLAHATDRRDGVVLDVLAAAYAADGRYEEASATADAALEALTPTQAHLAAAIRARRELYRNGQPYRESTGVTSSSE